MNWQDRVYKDLSEQGVARIPAGTYRLDVPFVLDQNERLELSPKTTLIGVGGPAVILQGRRSAVSGGTLKSDSGVVVHVSQCLFWSVEDCVIEGAKQSGVGLLVEGPICYFGQASNVEIRDVAVAVSLTNDANANEFFHVVGFNIGTHFWKLDRAYANKVFGGFCHGSGTRDGATGVAVTNGSMYNGVYGLGFEPGGKNCRFLDTDPSSRRNQFIVQNNSVAGPRLQGREDFVILSGDQLRTPGGNVHLSTHINAIETKVKGVEKSSEQDKAGRVDLEKELAKLQKAIDYVYNGARFKKW